MKQKQTNPYPNRLDIGIGSVDGYRVYWNDTGLVWQRTSAAGDVLEESYLEPSESDWIIFWNALDELDIWSWDSLYEPEFPTCGGTQWSVFIEYGERRLRSAGRDAWPPGFDKFLLLVQGFIGNLPFL